ncbi:extracellular matrix regulator RemB [Paraliobacillus sp. JSM ZJ581]|uniref:extracellular matrix regulator RemB n=1 Tax=Paraliobacillus sp. JSM ZJ581 TaxID=3342118 RepID=UPI0035A8C831
MFIHIGGDDIIESKDVIAMIDYQYISSSTINEKMVKNQQKANNVSTLDGEETKSIVITNDHIYYSPLSVLTLKKRASMIATISKLDDYSNDDMFEET